MATKSFASALLAVFLGSALSPRAVMATRTVGSSVADASGIGEICFAVDPSADPDPLASAIAAELELQHGPGVEGGYAAPEMESVTVENGEAIVTYKRAQPNARVVGIIPDYDSAIAVVPLSGGGACDRIGGVPYVAGGLLMIGGGVLSGLAAAGEFDGDGGGDAPTPSMVPQPTPTPREPVSPSR